MLTTPDSKQLRLLTLVIHKPPIAIKTTKYSDNTSSHIFYPISIETADLWDFQTVELMEEIGRRTTAATNDQIETMYLFQRISKAIQRGSSMAIQRSNSKAIQRGNSKAIQRSNSMAIQRGNSMTIQRGNALSFYHTLNNDID